MERAARQLMDWHTRFPTDPPVSVMVNIPGRQFSEPELIPSVQRILQETGLDAEHLHLEITETTAMADLERSVQTLHRLKDLGVHLHVDDFGTGYSSLSYLHRFPVDSLKVDRSFVTNLHERPENLAIVRTVVDLARSLGLSVVVEGIETEKQLAFIQGLGCDYGQGWLFARALDPTQVDEVLEDPQGVLKPLTRS
jgi:EAL domain-containing protein (putative c-di-GMP-specific phosphodiesterase class I)